MSPPKNLFSTRTALVAFLSTSLIYLSPAIGKIIEKQNLSEADIKSIGAGIVQLVTILGAIMGDDRTLYTAKALPGRNKDEAEKATDKETPSSKYNPKDDYASDYEPPSLDLGDDL